jgi:hypothetical protein
MKFPVLSLSLLLLPILSGNSSTAAVGPTGVPHRGILYLSPSPGAAYVMPASNLIVRFGSTLSVPAGRPTSPVRVFGSKSGVHPGSVSLSDDGKTMTFRPDSPFRFDERVDVQVDMDPPGEPSDGSSVISWSFFTKKGKVTPARDPMELMEFEGTSLTQGHGPFTGVSLHADTVPTGFPGIQSTVHGAPSSGYLFLSNLKFQFPPVIDPYLMILDNAGDPVFYRKMPQYCFDFKLQPNGLLTYYDNATNRFYALDSTYAVVDSFFCGNGYPTDLHELRLLDNGHSLLMSYDWQRVDMSQVVAGGDSNAVVIGLIIQELDGLKNVVFQWRSWDHFLITDAIGVNLLDTLIDYVHGNAIELDTDGNLLISSRHMSEVTKIDRTTGDIIWRLGGKNNEFTFVDDSLGFSYQHAIRRLPDGNITLFDNGNFRLPELSRALEYALDETTKTATLAWEFRNTPDIYGHAMGYVQRLPSGNTLVGWGSASTAVTEVRPDGSKVMELKFTESGMYSYRAYRFEWEPAVVSVPPDVPRAASLSQNYPNPFNGGTRVSFSLPRPSFVTLTIYDILGREVRRVIDNERRDAASYDIDLDFRQLSAGVYITRLSTDDFTQTRKMVYVP